MSTRRSNHSRSQQVTQGLSQGASHDLPGRLQNQITNQDTLPAAMLFGCLLLLAALTGCHGALLPSARSSSSQGPTFTVSGPVQVRAGDTATFSISPDTVQPGSLAWSVNNVVGGNSTLGTITPLGVYTASLNPGQVSISCRDSSSVTTTSSLTLTILNPLPQISSGIVISSDDVEFVLDLVGTGFVSASNVNISGSAVTTEVLSSTEIRATISLSANHAPTVGVTVSNPDPGAADSSVIEIALPPSTLHQPDGCIHPYDPTLNAPSGEWNASAGAMYLPNTYGFPLIGTPTYPMNTIYWTSREARPGDSVLMTGAFTGNNKVVKVALIPAGTADFQSVVRENGIIASTTQLGTTGLLFVVPQELPAGVYGFEVDDASAPTVFGLANAPSIQWYEGVPSDTDPNHALQSQLHNCAVESGELLRLFAKNLLPSSKVILESSDGSITSLLPSSIDANRLMAQIPDSLAPGRYYMWIGNGPWDGVSARQFH